MSRMRVKGTVFIVANVNPFSAKTGGIEVFVASLSNYLHGHGWVVSLVGIGDSVKKRTLFELDSFYAVSKKCEVSNYKFLIRLFLKSFSVRIGPNGIIHAQRPDLMLPFIWRKQTKICHVHGNPSLMISTKKNWLTYKIYNIIEKIVINKVNRVVTVDNQMKEALLRKYPKVHDKICTVPVGIDTARFRPMNRPRLRMKYGMNKEEKIVLYMGRFEPEKRLDFLVRQFRELQKIQPHSKLLLVGKGTQKFVLERLLKRTNTRDVTIMEGVTHEKVPEIMNCADVFALTSCSEGFPTVVLESLSCGVPVVSLNVGDVSKVVVNNKTGFIASEREFHERLHIAIKFSKRMKSNCVETARNYDWVNIGRQVTKIYGID